jgi:hypothetical protein
MGLYMDARWTVAECGLYADENKVMREGTGQCWLVLSDGSDEGHQRRLVGPTLENAWAMPASANDWYRKKTSAGACKTLSCFHPRHHADRRVEKGFEHGLCRTNLLQAGVIALEMEGNRLP